MDCTKVQEQILDSISSANAAKSAGTELSAHLAGCAECANLWQAMRSTSAALDSWSAPEPSPFFDTRFQARLAELKREQANGGAGAFAWLRRPFASFHSSLRVGAMALALAFAVGVGLYERPASQPANTHSAAEVSPAVNDLQKLDKNEDLYADFEMLDDIQTPAQPAAPATQVDSSKTEL